MSQLFMRKYRLVIETWRGDVIDVTSDLRVTFRIDKNITRFCQFGEITVYNLDPGTETDIFKNGKSLTLEAGYENGPYGLIFKGNIRQPIRGKEDAVTYFLKLVCIDGDEALNLGLCNFSLVGGQTAEEIINQIVRKSSVPFDIRVEPGLNQQKTHRGKVVFGQPFDELRSQALNNNSVVFFDNGVANFAPLERAASGEVPDINADNGMIGIPVQLDQGIEVRCLINPVITLDSFFKINNQDIIQNQVELGQLQTLLDLDGLYRVVAMIITGDTRGNDWYFDMTAYAQAALLPQMLTSPTQSGI